MTWSNPIPNTLWFATAPLPAFITADGPNFTLRMSGQSYQAPSIEEAQMKYEEWTIAALVTPFGISPQLPAFALPADGQLVAGKKFSGGFFFGTWSEANQEITQSPATISLADIAAWTSLPS